MKENEPLFNFHRQNLGREQKRAVGPFIDNFPAPCRYGPTRDGFALSTTSCNNMIFLEVT